MGEVVGGDCVGGTASFQVEVEVSDGNKVVVETVTHYLARSGTYCCEHVTALQLNVRCSC